MTCEEWIRVLMMLTARAKAVLAAVGQAFGPAIYVTWNVAAVRDEGAGAARTGAILSLVQVARS